MKIKTICNILMVMAMVAFATSCDDKNDCNYEPGAPTPEGCIGVYFNSSNAIENIFLPRVATELEVAVSRQNTESAVEVPLVVTADAGLNVPNKVQFAAGQATTTIKITFSNLEESKKYNYSIAVPEEYADHYTEVDGTTAFRGYIMEADWKTISDNVTMKWTTLGVQNTFVGTLMQLGTTNRYRFVNFLDSGMDYIFTVGDSSTAYTGYYSITTYANYESYEGTEAKAAYFFDEATQSYPTWTVADGTIEVEYILILEDYYGTNTGYSCISFDKHSGYVYLYWTKYTDGTYDYYNPVSFSWK
ncbi:MAG: hypothetical protein ACI4B3_10720 [Prevotella sp.]